ncbi:MAG: TonB-dependent receptor [Proteobacteria bacterium]|nr:TonB-dependent receptor [Pseudomonadota bacterium]
MARNLKLPLKTIATLVSIVPLACLAQEPRLSQVIITAPKLEDPSLSASSLGERSLAPLRSSTSDTASLLRDIPGVSLYGNGGVSSLPAIHGMADDRVRVKVDGMDLIAACPNHMNSPLSYIDPTKVGGVKVFAGIAPVSVGGDSIGGSILVNSAHPEFATAGQGTLLKGQAGVFHRSNGNANGANLAATIAGKNINMTYSGSTAESGNYKAAKDFKAAGPAAVDGAGGPAAMNRGWLGGDVIGSSRYKSENQELGFALRHDKHLIELKLGFQHIPYEGFPNQRMDMTRNDSTLVNLRYTGQYRWGALEVRVYEEQTRHKMDFADDKQFVYGPNPPSTIVAPGMPMYTEGKNAGALVKADIPLSARDVLKLGGEAQHYRLNDWWPPSPSSLAGMVSAPGVPATAGGMAPDTFWNINNGKRDRLGVFAEWEARWNPEWLTLLGARAEQVKMDVGPVQGYNAMTAGYAVSAAAFNARGHGRSDNNLDLTALTRYTPDATRTFEIGYARKTRSPNLYERYSWSQNSMALIMNNFVGDGNGYLGNLDLKPEMAHTLSATLDWHDAARTREFKLTPYYTRVTNFVDAVRCTGSGMMMNALCGGTANNTARNLFVQLQYANQSARFHGVDISGRVPLAKISDYGSFSGTGVVNYVRGENRTTGDNLYNIMPLNVKLAVVQSLGTWSNTAEVQLVDAKTHVSQARQEVRTGGYGLLNLRSSYEWNEARLDIGIENLSNRFYSLPLGGAYVGQGATMGTNTIPWGIPIPGMGRSIYAGLSVKF